MDQSLEVKHNIKNESTDSTSSDRLEFPTKMQLNSIKQEDNFIYIKTDPQNDESEFRVVANTSDDDSEFKMYEPIVNIVMENPEVEMMIDPLAAKMNNEKKDEEYFSVDLEGGSGIKTEPTTGEKYENLLATAKNYSHGSGSNQIQDQLLISIHKDKKYVCYICSKTFTHKGNLEQHLRIHTGEKPFSCNVCKKSFNTKRSLDRHMLIHSGEKPYICDVCKKVYRHKSNLNDHMLIHSNEIIFSCDMCDKIFTHKQNLAKHKRIHTGNKPHGCDMCNKAFIRKSQLTQHKRIHTGTKPFFCDICNKSFAAQSNLITHKKIHKNY